MTMANFQILSQIPLPNSVNEKFCSPVRLASDFIAWAYVPTSAERIGDFSATPASSQLIDPLVGTPFPGGMIPASRLPDPMAWRIAAAGPAPGEPCMTVPALPQFNTSYYVTGRDAQADRLLLDRNSLVGTIYQIGDPFPADQVVNVFNTGQPVAFLVTNTITSGGVDTSRWLKITVPPPCCQTPASLRFSIQPVGLGAGFYGATVSVTPLGAIGPSVPISVGVFVQTPPAWIVVNPPALQFSLQPGGPLPGGQVFNVSLPVTRAYVVTSRVISPAGANWVGVSSSSGVGPGTIGVFITSQAASLPPGSYMALIDVIGGSPALSPALVTASPRSANSGVMCGGGLSDQQLAVFLDVGKGAITISPTLAPDSDGLPLVGLSASIGGALPQPPALTFQPVGAQNVPFDVKFAVRNPDTTNLPLSNWLDNAPFSAKLPIIVTPTLDPIAIGTLAPCDYEGYISVSNNNTGAIVKLKLTLLPGAGNSPPNVTQVMSQIADGGTDRAWKTSIILVNTDTTVPARFQLTFHPGMDMDRKTPISPDAPFNVTGPGQVGNRMYADTIPPGGSVTLATKGPGAPFWQGWAELSAPQSVGGTAIFAQALDANSDAEGSVLLKPAAGTSFFLPFDNNSATGLLTTMALVNTSATVPANVTVKFHNESGVVFSQSANPIMLAPGGHQAFALVDRFPVLADMRGVAEFISDGPPLAGLGLRFNQRQSTFTSFEIATPQAGAMRQGIAHIPDGGTDPGAWKTSITLVNLDPAQTNVVVMRFHNGQDTPPNQALVLENAQLGNDGTYTVTLGPNGSATISTRGLGGFPLWQGWAEVDSSTTLGGFAVFRHALLTGQGEGTVPFTPLGSARFVLPFDNSNATGVAIVNTSDQGATLAVGFRDPTGKDIVGVANAQKTIPLGPAIHRAFILSDPKAPLGGPALDKINGIADFTATFPGLIGIGLRFSPRNAFTSLPIILK